MSLINFKTVVIVLMEDELERFSDKDVVEGPIKHSKAFNNIQVHSLIKNAVSLLNKEYRAVMMLYSQYRDVRPDDYNILDMCMYLKECYE